MRTKPVHFLDTSEGHPRVWYGVRVYIQGRWALVSREDPETGKQKPVLFDNEQDLEAKRKELRQIHGGY